MILRNINPSEIDEFCHLGLDEEMARNFQEKILKAWEEKRSYPEWCFVTEENGKFTSRVAFDIFPSEPRNLMVWGLYVPEGEYYIERGTRLFKAAAEKFKSQGFKLIEHHLYGKNDKKFEMLRELFLESGFKVMQEKKNFLFTDGELPPLSGRLTFKSLREVGEEKYINAIMKVTENTLDTYDQMEVREMGAGEAAKSNFYGLKDIDYNEDWWKLAYEKGGDLAGLIIPHKFSEKVGAINYIGVVPEKRGNGYVMDLLAMGTSILKNNGIEEIIADIDINNFPMENALRRAGYRLNQMELVFEIRF